MLTLSRMLVGKAGWLLLSFLIIVAVLALWNRLPAEWREWQVQAENAEIVSRKIMVDQVGFLEEAQDYQGRLDEQFGALHQKSDAELVLVERELAASKLKAQERVLTGGELASAAARGRTDDIMASSRAQLFEVPLLERSLDIIAMRKVDLEITSFDEAIAKHRAEVAAFRALVTSRDIYQRRAEAQRRYPACRRAPTLWGCSLVRTVIKLDAEIGRKRAALEAQANQLRVRRAVLERQRTGLDKTEDVGVILADATRTYQREAQRLSAQARGYVLNQAEDALGQHSQKALLILLGAVLLPILLKLFTFLAIAPLAARSRPIRLHDGGSPLVGTASGMSVEVGLDPDSELLLRAGLQSSATDVQGGDQYVLDWRMPFTCLAAGLVNLQRLRSGQSDHVVVTGTDSNHRVAVIEVPSGGAVVLQPRALLGVRKPRNSRLVISRPWQLHRLIAWITMQLRYVLFHGPCTLIVQGRDGVQIEEASHGRMINKRLTLGFDAGLAYGAARSASFLPYLRGQTSLFNDRFDGSGRYLYEQRPTGVGKGSLWGRGVRGIGDGILSAVGI